MRTYYLLLFFALGLFLSCSGKKDRPEDVLSKEEMADAMIEYSLKESRINSLQLQKDSALALFQYYREQYASEKSIPDSVFEISYQYYLSHPAEFSEVYDRIIDSLVLREQRARVK